MTRPSWMELVTDILISGLTVVEEKNLSSQVKLKIKNA